MTLSPWVVLWVLGAPALLGVLVLRACGLRPADDRLGFVAWVWPAGCLALGASLFCYLLLRVEPWLWWTAPPFAALLFALLAARRMGRAAAPRLPAPAVGRGFVALVIAGALWCLLHVAAGASRPCVEGDEGNIWSLKGKSLLVDWYGGDFAAAQHWNLHADYPLLNPLLQAWVHAEAGGLVQFECRLPVQLCALALWLATAAALRARLPALPAGLLLLLLPFGRTFLEQARIAYADGMVALGVVLALDGVLRWRATGRPVWLGLGSLGAAFALWSKNEAMLYLAAAAAAGAVGLSVRGARARGLLPRLLLGLLPPLAVVIVQLGWNRHFGLSSDLFGQNPTGRSLPALALAQFAERAPVVLDRVATVLLGFAEPHAVFAVLLLSPLLWRRAALGRELLPATLWLLGSFAGLHLVYVGSWLPLAFHLDTSYVRVLFQLLPATLVWCAALARALRAGDDPGRPAA